MAIERTLDLHGQRSDAAEHELERFLDTARRDGVRAVQIITGVGNVALGSGTLRRSLPGWLTEPPLARHVLAFGPAHARDGGLGATNVLLLT